MSGGVFDAQKRAMLELLLPACPFLAIDAMRPHVEVPAELRRADLILRIGEDPQVLGMPDLTLGPHGWAATISLRGARHYVEVPYHAVRAAWISEPFSGPQIVWPEEPVPAARPTLRAVP